MVHDRQEAVGVRRKINADDLRFFVDDVVDKTRILMCESIVVLSPDMGGKQDIEGGEFPAPRKSSRDFQPFGMLVEHRVDDMYKSFVAIEETVSAGKQVAFHPAFALVFAEDLHDTAIGVQVFIAG